MSDPIAIISSAMVTRDELLEFIVQEGGFINPNSSLFGRLSEGSKHIWIGLDSSEPEVTIADQGHGYFNSLTQLLSGPPCTWIVVEISRTEGSEALAIQFAIRFCDRWPAIVDNLDGQVLTQLDLIKRQTSRLSIR